MALCLVAFARLAFAAGDPELAALLAGAAPGLRQQARRRAWPVLRRGEADALDDQACGGRALRTREPA